MEVGGQLNAPAALPQGKSPQYPLNRRLGGPHIHMGTFTFQGVFTFFTTLPTRLLYKQMKCL